MDKKIKKVKPIEIIKPVKTIVKPDTKAFVIAEGLFKDIKIIEALNEPTIIEIKLDEESTTYIDKNLTEKLKKIKNIRLKISGQE